MILLTQAFCGTLGLLGRATILYLLLSANGSAINSTAITQQPPAHSTPTSPIQTSLTIPQGVDPTDETLKGVINDPQISKSSLKEVFDKVSSAVGNLGNLLTPQKPEGVDNGENPDTNSETSETSMVNDDQVPPSNSKTYTQHDLDKLRTHWEEQFKLQKAIDKKILDKEIQNHYLCQIQSLKSEHQEQLATIESEIAAIKIVWSQLMHKKPMMSTPFKCSNRELSCLKGPVKLRLIWLHPHLIH